MLVFFPDQWFVWCVTVFTFKPVLSSTDLNLLMKRKLAQSIINDKGSLMHLLMLKVAIYVKVFNKFLTLTVASQSL